MRRMSWRRKRARPLAAALVVLALCVPAHAQDSRTDVKARAQLHPFAENGALEAQGVLSTGAFTTALVLSPSPIFEQPDTSLEPLRVAKEGSALRLVEQSGEWCKVEFQDPQYGRRLGYIQTKFVQVNRPSR